MPDDDENVEEWDGEGVPVVKEDDKQDGSKGSRGRSPGSRTQSPRPTQRDPNKPNPDEGRLGSSYDRLRDIINEVSRTDKVEGIIRAFSKYKENDLKQLWNVLSLAGIGHRDKSFIIHNWATEIDTEIPDTLKKQINPDYKPTDEKKDKEDSMEDFYDFQKKQLEKELEMVKYEQQIASQRRAIKMMGGGNDKDKDDEIKELKKMIEEKLSNQNNLVSIHEKVPMYENGKLLRDERGNPMYKEVTRMVTPEQASHSTNERSELEKNLMMMKMMRDIMGPREDPNIRKLEDDARWKDFELKFKDQQDFYEGEIGRLEQKYDDREKELKHNRELEDLRNEIHETRKMQEQSDERFNVNANKELIEKGQKEVRDGVDGLRNDFKDGMDRLVDEQIAQKQFERKVQEMNIARAMGMTPSEYRDYYEKSTVPEVDEEELARQAGVELIDETSSAPRKEKPELRSEPFQEIDPIGVEPVEPSFLTMDDESEDDIVDI